MTGLDKKFGAGGAFSLAWNCCYGQIFSFIHFPFNKWRGKSHYWFDGVQASPFALLICTSLLLCAYCQNLLARCNRLFCIRLSGISEIICCYVYRSMDYELILLSSHPKSASIHNTCGRDFTTNPAALPVLFLTCFSLLR